MAVAVPISCLISFNEGKCVPAKTTILSAFKPVIKNVSRTTKFIDHQQPDIIRRSGNYKPSIWDNNFLQSLTTDYTNESYKGRAQKLKKDVGLMFNNIVLEPIDQMELIDHLQRLGVAHHFGEEIERTLWTIYTNNDKWEKDLHATALKFRLLRQHGYHTSPEVFKVYTKNGRFKESIGGDIKGMLSLYEASYFIIEGESLMEEAWGFTNNILRERVGDINDSNLDMQVRHALELPLQWRIPGLEARWYIDMYETSSNMNSTLLEFAKLDFNIVQGLYQQELKDLSRWWNKTGLGDKLSFARDRLVASYLWTVGITCEPQNGYCRVQTAKTIEFITVIDDVYDVYGTLDELELFTSVIERWDISAMKELPDYMKICFLALYNYVNEIVYDILKEQNVDVLPYIRKAWVDLIRRYLVEARWYHSGYKPTLEEYLNNGMVSIAAPTVVILSYISSMNPIKKDEIEFLDNLPEVLRLSSTIFRLADDYGTSTDELNRGDVPKSIQCYMSDTGVSEEVAREHMMDLMRKKWAQVNRCRFSEAVPLSRSFVETMLNLTRTSHCFYHDGDGYGIEEGKTQDRLFPLVIQPIPL